MAGIHPPLEAPAARASLRRPTLCDVCGGATFEERCKIICPRCGYTRDCSDP